MLGERIKTALASKKMSVNKLSREIGMGQTTLNDQLRGRTSLTSDTVELIMPYLDGISAEWLLRGEGDMEKGFFKQLVKEIGCCGDITQVAGSDVNEVIFLRDRIKKLEEEKERLLGIIEQLTKR